MKKVSFYNSFKKVDTNLKVSKQTASFSVEKEMGACDWHDRVGTAVTQAFNSEHSRQVSNLKRQFDALVFVDKQIPEGDALDFLSQHPFIVNEIESCIVRE